MHGRLLTRRTVPALVAALSLGAAGVADAATVRVTGGNTLVITDAAAEQNVLTFWRGEDAGANQVIFVRQSQGVNDLPQEYPEGAPPPPAGVPLLPDLVNGCVPTDDQAVVKCTASGKFTAVNANLGGGLDFVSNPVVSGSQPLDSATKVTLKGEAGPDVLLGTPNGDVLSGGEDNDDLRGNAGDDTLEPGNGQSQSLRGGEGSDTVVFNGADRSKANMNTAVTLDDRPNDGGECTTASFPVPAACEANNVRSDVENVVTGNGDDTIIASLNPNVGDVSNRFTTNGGTDVVTSLGGADTLALGEGADRADAGAGNDDIDGAGGDDNLDGAAGDDTIKGAAGANTIFGRDGVDTITAGDQADTIDAGPGNDLITNAGGGNDAITAGEGDDLVVAGEGDNTIDLGPGNDGKAGDPAMAGAGKDTITGGGGDDYITAGAGDNVVSGDAGNDTVTAGNGDDKVLGGDGTDIITTTDGNDYLQGGLGPDTLDAGGQDGTRQSRQFAKANVPAGSYTGDTIDYSDKTTSVYAITGNSSSGTDCAPPAPQGCEGDSITSAENFIGGEAGDWFVGDASVNTLDGNGGSDKLEAKDGNDFVLGGAGDDSQLVGGAGGDYIAGGAGTDFVSYIDSLEGVTVTLDGQPGDGAPGENDNLQGDLENIEGSNFNDYLEGSGGPNRLMGRELDDELVGLGGPDVLQGDGGVDLANYESRNDDLDITLDNVANDGGAGELDNVLSDVENLTTGSGNDDIVAADADNTIVTNGGADVIDGLRGSDDVSGGDGADTVVYSARPATERVQVTLDDNANDGTTPAFGSLSTERDNIRFDVENLRGGDEADYFEGGVQPNILEGGGGNDSLFGDQQNDRLVGGAGDDELQAGDGNDVVQPGLGADYVSGEGGTDAVDYLERAPGTVTVTLDNEANDGEAGEGDNVLTDIEEVRTNGTPPATTTTTTTTTTPPATTPKTEPSPEPAPEQQSTTVSPTAEPRDPATSGSSTSRQGTSMETTSKLVRSGSFRSVLVRGRILVKARQGFAKTSAACKGGGRVLVTITKGKRVVGKRLVSITRTCGFKAPVTLKKGTAGKVKVQVRFLGNKMLKATKRTTSLQVNG